MLRIPSSFHLSFSGVALPSRVLIRFPNRKGFFMIILDRLFKQSRFLRNARIPLLSACLCLALATPSKSQEAANTIHFELLGNGLLYSINYDRLFTHSVSGRIGYMYLSADGTSEDPTDPKITVSMSLIPVTMSYLAGAGNHKLEMGGGPVMAIVSAEIDDGVQGVSGSGLATVVGIFGYRFQPAEGGFNFRVAFTPHILIDGDEPFLPWGGMSFGYSF
jgi:hypothetical protein